uniref:Uncharacterized protein n=1 Tax=Vitis vinifera TaxID=29760 RepID=F6HTD6_VITVI
MILLFRPIMEADSKPSPCSQFRHLEPSSVFRSTFRVASSVSVFKVVITVFSSAFRAIITHPF